MRTGKEVFNKRLQELNDMGLPGMSTTLDEMYRSPKFIELDPLTSSANLVEPECERKMNKRILSRLRDAHVRKSCPIALILPSVSICPVPLPERCPPWNLLTPD